MKLENETEISDIRFRWHFVQYRKSKLFVLQTGPCSKGYSLDYDFYTQECNGKYYKDYLPLLIPNPSEELMEEIHDLKKGYIPITLDRLLKMSIYSV